MKIKRGSTSQKRLIFIRDTTSTTGAGLTGLVYNSASLTAYYIPDGASSATAITLVTATVGTFTSGGFKEVSSSNMPGWYEIGIPNAALSSGTGVAIHLKGATNMAPVNIFIELDAVDYQSATAFITGVNSLAPPSNWNVMSIDGSGKVSLGDGAISSTTFASGAITHDALADSLIQADNIAPGAIDDEAMASGAVNATSAPLLASIASYIDTEVAAIKAKTDNLPSDPADASDIAALFVKVRKYFQLSLRKDAAIATDNATELTELNASGGSGVGGFVSTTDSQEALRDRGDAAWVTGSATTPPAISVEQNVISGE